MTPVWCANWADGGVSRAGGRLARHNGLRTDVDQRHLAQVDRRTASMAKHHAAAPEAAASGEIAFRCPDDQAGQEWFIYNVSTELLTDRNRSWGGLQSVGGPPVRLKPKPAKRPPGQTGRAWPGRKTLRV